MLWGADNSLGTWDQQALRASVKGSHSSTYRTRGRSGTEGQAGVLQPSRSASPDIFGDGELGSCEAGARGHAHHRWQGGIGQYAARHANPKAPDRREGRWMERGATQLVRLGWIISGDAAC